MPDYDEHCQCRNWNQRNRMPLRKDPKMFVNWSIPLDTSPKHNLFQLNRAKNIAIFWTSNRVINLLSFATQVDVSVVKVGSIWKIIGFSFWQIIPGKIPSKNKTENSKKDQQENNYSHDNLDRPGFPNRCSCELSVRRLALLCKTSHILKCRIF